MFKASEVFWTDEIQAFNDWNLSSLCAGIAFTSGGVGEIISFVIYLTN